MELLTSILEAIGSAILVLPRLHPIARSFYDFAPLRADMFPEATFIYMTDLEKIAYRHPSIKFDMPDLQLGNKILSGGVTGWAIESAQLAVEELSASRSCSRLHSRSCWASNS